MFWIWESRAKLVATIEKIMANNEIQRKEYEIVSDALARERHRADKADKNADQLFKQLDDVVGEREAIKAELEDWKAKAEFAQNRMDEYTAMYNQDVHTARDELAKLSAEFRDVLNERDAWEKACQPLRQELASAKTELHNLKSVNDGAIKTIKAGEERLARAEKERDEARAAHQVVQRQRDGWRKSYEASREELDLTAKERDEWKARAGNVASVRDQDWKANTDLLNRLQKDHDIWKARAEARGAEGDKLLARNTSLEDQLHAKRHENETLRRTIEDGRDNFVRLTKEHEELKKQREPSLVGADRETRDLKVENGALKEQLRIATNARQVSETSFRGLQEETAKRIAKLEGELNRSYEQRKVERDELKMESGLSNANATIARLAKEIAELKIVEGERNIIKEKLRRYENGDLNELQKAISSARFEDWKMVPKDDSLVILHIPPPPKGQFMLLAVDGEIWWETVIGPKLLKPKPLVDENGKCECGREAAFAAPEAHDTTCSYRIAREREAAMER